MLSIPYSVNNFETIDNWEISFGQRIFRDTWVSEDEFRNGIIYCKQSPGFWRPDEITRQELAPTDMLMFVLLVILTHCGLLNYKFMSEVGQWRYR